jgi:hypothetical protein
MYTLKCIDCGNLHKCETDEDYVEHCECGGDYRSLEFSDIDGEINVSDISLTDREAKSTFIGVSKKLNVDYVPEPTIADLDKKLSDSYNSKVKKANMKNRTQALITELQTEVQNIDNRKDLIEESINRAKINDAGFLEREIKSLILSSRRVLETLEKDIKLGSQPRMYEVYATLLGAITGQYKELRNLNESIAKFVIENKKQNLEEVKEDHKMMLSSDDALDMYMNAKSVSQMDSISAEFEIVEEGLK